MSLKLKLFRITAVILLVLQMTLIFCFSAQKSDKSKDLSEGFTYKIASAFYPEFDEMEQEEQIEIVKKLHFFVRKLAHFSLFAILGFFSLLSLVTYKKVHFAFRCIFAFLLSVLYAVSDEYHQTFVDGRVGCVQDVLIDSVGALTAIVFTIIIILLSRKLRYSLVLNKTLDLGGKALRKKELLLQNESLFDKLNKSQAENSLLKKQISQMKKEIEDLKCQLSDVLKPEPLKEEENTPLKHIEEKVLKKEITADFDYASKVIGEIVVSSANYSNQLTQNGNTEYKELVNLILGRCEIAKADILAAVTSLCDNNTKIQLINSIKNETEEYFLSVMAQIN